MNEKSWKWCSGVSSGSLTGFWNLIYGMPGPTGGSGNHFTILIPASCGNANFSLLGPGFHPIE